MRVTVCELPGDPDRLEEGWDGLVAHVTAEGSDLVILPEMPFSRWLAATKDVEPAEWDAAAAAHAAWVGRFGELGGAAIASSSPVVRDGKRLNEAFVWDDGDYRIAHDKYYLPDEDFYWEATWYERGDGSFDVIDAAGETAGFLVCSELWFPDRARAYGRAGASIIAAPRATPWSSRERWLVAGRHVAISAGAFCLSSNRSGDDPSGLTWAGLGWVIDPEGVVLAETSADQPYVTVDIEPALASAARSTYPRYIPE
ncbi:MAG TPA: carbon-nitrogen hydrolase family protein [Acidimicrobiia bacterium]|nr:carbon-nitrogen hydrolase family protein [Acidimicrobiia bacterium]